MIGVPNKSEWGDIGKALSRPYDQNTTAARLLRVGIHMTYPEVFKDYYDPQKLRDHFEEAWSLFWKKGEFFF